jgi:hypothetical protein
VFTNCTRTCNVYKLQTQVTQLSAFLYHHGDSSIGYLTPADYQFLQLKTSITQTHNKLTSQPHTDTCTTFRYVNMLTYCTFLLFLSTLHHSDWGNIASSMTLWKTWKVDEEMWTMLGQTDCYFEWDAKISVPAVAQSPPATLCLSCCRRVINSVPAACNTSVTWHFSELRMI